VAVFLNGHAVRTFVGEGFTPATYTTLKNLVAASLLLALTTVATRGGSRAGFTRPRSGRQWAGLVFVGVIGGSVPFLLFFEGLARASSTQAALLHKSLLIWVAILAVPLLGERLNGFHFAAIGLLIAGQIALAGGVTDLGLGTGEWMVLMATVLWAVEVVVAKRLLTNLSPLTVGTARMAIGIIVLVGYGIATGAFGGLTSLTGGALAWVLLTGLVLTAYVTTWYAGLARAQAVDVTAVLVFGAVVTALLRNGFDGAALPSPAGLVLVTFGAVAAVAAGFVRSRGVANGL
jgi:drug/metabolite transporter (DMT)-like permease